MRILIINSEYPPIGGGAGNASAHIAHWLARLGHEVTLLTARFADLPHQEQQDGVQIIRAPALRRQQDRSGALEQATFILGGSSWALRLTRRFKPHVTLAFFGVPGGAIAWLLKALFKIPYVVSLRGGDVPGFRPYDFRTYHRIIGPALRVIWRQAAAVVANSHGLQALASAFNGDAPISIIPNGVDCEQFAAPAREWSPPRLLSVGRVVHQKGFDLSLRALANMSDLSWEFRIAGDGPQTAALQTMADEFDIGDRVRFLGWQSKAELMEHYRWANLFVFASRHEGMPNAVLEAMASGLPVVATRIAGNEELVVEGETGFLVQTENVDELRDALRKMLTNSALRKKMGAASRLRVEQNYTWQKVAEQYQMFLEQAARRAL